MGRFGAAVGSGAAKLGKRAAQSEAGRSAGRAAVAGATEGVKQDLNARYFGGPGEEAAPSPPAPQPQSKPKEKKSSDHKPAVTPTSPAIGSPSWPQGAASPVHREPRPPKPSLLTRFKPHIGKSSDKKAKPPPRRRTSRKDHVYKYNLSKEANWDAKLLVQALYNFRGEMKCDLEFRKGQVIQVLTKTDSQFDWWEGKIEDRVGIFPANYVKTM